MDDKDLAVRAQRLETLISQGDARKFGAALLQEYLAGTQDTFGKLLEKTKSLNDTDRRRFAFLPTIDFTDPSAKNFEVDLGRLTPGLSFLLTGSLDKQSIRVFEVRKENPPETFFGRPSDMIGDPAMKEVTIVDGAKPESGFGNSVLITQNHALVDSFLPFTLGVARPDSTLIVESPYQRGKVCAESGAKVQVEGSPEYAKFFAEPKATILGKVPFTPVPEGFCEKTFLPILLEQMSK